MTTRTSDERAEGELYSATAGRSYGRVKIFLCAAVTLVVVVAAIRAGVCWWNARYLTPTNGVWLALATDLKNGVFYRPLLGPVGYGGTRYFPLFFVLYALLLKLGVPVLQSGYLLSGAALVLLLIGTYILTRRLGAQPWLSACSAGAVLAAGSVQLSLLSIHDDGLACALNVCGLAAISHPRLTRAGIVLASVLFTLAWSTKITTLFGFAAAFSWLILTGLSGKAWQLAIGTVSGYLAVAASMFLASHGRIVTIFKACASAGTNPIRILLGPFHMLSIAVRDDPGLLLFFFLALILLPNRVVRSLPVLFFIATIAVTAFIFGSPGTSWNHLLDLQVASVIFIAACLADTDAPLLKRAGAYSFALAVLLAAIPVVHSLQAEDRVYPPRRFERAIALIGPTQRPILAENPLLAVLADQRPYVMDPFMFRVVRQHVPNFSDTLFDALRRQAFSAVVLTKDTETATGKAWYQNDIFGPGFLPALNERYRLASVLDDQYIYLPTSAASPAVGDPNNNSSVDKIGVVVADQPR